MSAPAPDVPPRPASDVCEAISARPNRLDDPEASRHRIRELEQAVDVAREKSRCLEMLARGTALPELLAAVCGFVEKHFADSCACILVFDPTGGQVAFTAEAGLPQGLAQLLEACPAVGDDQPWNAATTEDLSSDWRTNAPAWRRVALAAGLRLCWSTLIRSEETNPVGSLTVFWREPRRPTSSEAALLAEMSALSALLIARSRADAALRASEERFRSIFDGVPGMICTMTANGEVEMLNRQVIEFFGRTLAELKDWTMIDAVHPGDLPRVIGEWNEAVETGTPFNSEQRQRRTDGVYRWHLSRALPARDKHGRVTGWNMLIADVDDRKKAEEALKRSEAYLTEAQRLSHTGSFGWKVKTGELVWSAETYRILGYDRPAPPDFAWVVTRIHPEDRERVRLTLEQTVPGRAELNLRHRLLMPDGTVRHLHVVARAAEPHCEDQEYIGVVMDITEQTRAEESVQAAKARFEGILAIAHDAIISVDSEQRVILFNQGAEKVFGYAAAEIVGQALDRLLPERFVTAHRHHLKSRKRGQTVVC